MRRLHAGHIVLVGLLALPHALPAQPNNDKPTAPPSAQTTPAGQRTVRAMFNFADVDRNGQLTRDEAKGHLPFTHSDFLTIDTDNRGWISFEQFVAYTNKRVGKQADDILHSTDRL